MFNPTMRKKVVGISAADKFPMIQIQYIGALAYGNYAVVGDVLTLFADDTDGATTTVLALDTSDADSNTFAEVKAKIEATGVFRCNLLGISGLATSTSALVAIANATCKTVNGVTLFMDDSATATAFDAGICITNQKFTSRPTGGFSSMSVGRTYDSIGKFNAPVINQIDYIDFILTCVGDGVIEIYSIDDLTGTETLLWSNAWVTATREYHGDSEPDKLFLQGLIGQRLLMHIDRVTAATEITSPGIIVHGKTTDESGGCVPDANYTGCA